MPISYDDAYNATNPELPEDRRKASALAIVSGTAANEAYWNSRSDLEALKARADGHGVVARDASNNPPTASVTQTETAGAIEGTVVSDSTTPAGESEPHPLPSPDNPTAAVATLRKQLQDAGISPEA